MASLVRTIFASPVASNSLPSSEIPTPFPRELFEQQRSERSLEAAENISGPSQLGPALVQQVEDSNTLDELLPSIHCVQESCLTTLNNLLSAPSQRNLNVPCSGQQDVTETHEAESSSSALHTLISNLRNQGHSSASLQLPNKSDIIEELRVRVDAMSAKLNPLDAALAKSLVSLITHFYLLSPMQAPVDSNTNIRTSPTNPFETLHRTDSANTLQRRLNDLQIEQQWSQEATNLSISPVRKVETALLWSQIDHEMDTIVSMGKNYTEASPHHADQRMPPRYTFEDDDFDHPPDYEPRTRKSLESKQDVKLRDFSTQASPTSSRHVDEKMKLDLETVTLAIDRLYLVAPQLHNQRVELKSSKLAQMERASREGASNSKLQSKGKSLSQTPDIKELENIMDILGKSSARKKKNMNQSVVPEGGAKRGLQIPHIRKTEKTALFENLAQHSDAGRLHGQDAVLTSRIKESDTLLTLPEFIRESRNGNVMRQQDLSKDPNTLLSLPEFVKELSSRGVFQRSRVQLASNSDLKGKKTRIRSSSAPPFSWLLPSSSKLSGIPGQLRSPGVETEFGALYVAENHENLRHIQVFFTVTNATLGIDLEAEIPMLVNNGVNSILILKSGTRETTLLLPGHALPGKQAIRVQGDHYEIKVSTISSSEHGDESTSLLGASRLTCTRPSSFICSSCSLTLVQSTQIATYRDLPSEHWEELVEAWMCHSDQQLHDQVMKHGKTGFWPQATQALVGASYIIFEESCVRLQNVNIEIRKNIRALKDIGPLIRCLCGAVVGRCQSRSVGNGVELLAYRFMKYSMRPISPLIPIPNIPLTAYVVEDMMEHVHAHALHRFVIQDEEFEMPQILLWLFKPRMSLAYNISSSYSTNSSAVIEGAKVLYKLLSADVVVDIEGLLAQYPGFPQAVHLSYPMDACDRLAMILKESNLAYPETMRQMTGLEVGWLQRVGPPNI